MTINIEALIHCLGKSYQEIVDAELIPYKTKPAGSSGDFDISLDMVKEGIYLSFRRNGCIFQEMTLHLKREGITAWVFPNDLPLGLKKEMSREWVHHYLGQPDKSVEPRMVLKTYFGWVERFTIKGGRVPTVMRLDYDLAEMVKSITFLPTAELRW